MRKATNTTKTTLRTALGLLLALAAGVAGLAVTAQPARADHLGSAIGASGQLYAVTAGLYGTLFPGASAYDAATPVLALDTTLPGGSPQRQLVPSSTDANVESLPALIYEDSSKTLYVVWVSTSHSASSDIMLSSYDGANWSPAITILSDPIAAKTAPQLALTRDTHQEVDPTSGNPVTRHRTVLHIVWSENMPSGYQAFYAPVIFEEGVWIGTVPMPIHLNIFDAYDQAGQPGPSVSTGPLSTPLALTPAVEPGRDTTTVITGFASNVSGLLTSVEVDVLPEELRILGDAVSAAILGSGAQYFPNQLTTLATQVQGVIQSNGAAFQPEALQAISSGAQAQITAGSPDLPSMAQRTRSTIIEVGAMFAKQGLRIGGSTTIPPQVLEVLVPGSPSQFLQFRVAASIPWPAIGGTANLQMFLSRTGFDFLTAWTTPSSSAVSYFNTQPDGTWSTVNQLQTSTALSQQQAFQMLEQRVQ